MPILARRINLSSALCGAAALLSLPAHAQTAPAPVPPPAHHHVRPHHPHRQAMAVQQPSPLGAKAAPAAPALPGSPAPVPDEAAGPPSREEQAQATDVSPTVMQLHYPETGNGYLPGSSPSSLDDEQTPKAGGVLMTMKLHDAPTPLPPPTQPATPP